MCIRDSPYNVNQLTQKQAIEMLHKYYEIERWVKRLKEERENLEKRFSELPLTVKVFPVSYTHLNRLKPDGSPHGKLVYVYNPAGQVSREIYATADKGCLLYTSLLTKTKLDLTKLLKTKNEAYHYPASLVIYMFIHYAHTIIPVSYTHLDVYKRQLSAGI